MFWPFTIWINFSSDLKIFKNSRLWASNFKSFSKILEHFFLTVCQNNFGNERPFQIMMIGCCFVSQSDLSFYFCMWERKLVLYILLWFYPNNALRFRVKSNSAKKKNLDLLSIFQQKSFIERHQYSFDSNAIHISRDLSMKNLFLMM